MADEVARRLQRIFVRDEHGRVPYSKRRKVPERSALARLSFILRILHGDDGAGIGASQQSGCDQSDSAIDAGARTRYVGSTADGAAMAIIARVANPRRNQRTSCRTNVNFKWDSQASRRFGIRYCIRLFVNDPAQSFEIVFRKRRQLPSDPESATARPEIGTIGEI